MKLWSIILLACCIRAEAATWYAAADGASTNGSRSQPWSVTYAFTNSSVNPHLKYGDTVLFKSGTYYATNDVFSTSEWDVTNSIGVYQSGVTYKSESLWGFKLFGGLQFPPGAAAVSNVTISQIHFDLGKFRSYTNGWEEIFGLNIWGGHGITLSHNLIENFSGGGVGKWAASSNTVIEGNIVRFNGAADWTGRYGATPFERGSGMYTENAAGTALFLGNILYHNHTHGLSIKTGLVGFSVTNNIAVAMPLGGINMENNDAPTYGINIVSNYCWSEVVGGVAMQLGYDWWGLGTHPTSYGNSNVVVIGNTAVGTLKGLNIDNQAKDVTVLSNTVVRLGAYGDGGSAQATEYQIISVESKPATNSPAYSFSGNSYFAPSDTDYNLRYWGTGETFTAWQTILTDAGASYSTTLPTQVVSYASRPYTNLDFVHVVVFNWPTNATTSVDLSAFFTSGDRLYLYDAQNIPTVFTNFVYGGGTVELPLGLTDRAPMTVEFDDTPAWTGFDPRLRAFVIYRNNVASTASVGTLRVGTMRMAP